MNSLRVHTVDLVPAVHVGRAGAELNDSHGVGEGVLAGSTRGRVDALGLGGIDVVVVLRAIVRILGRGAEDVVHGAGTSEAVGGCDGCGLIHGRVGSRLRLKTDT